ncbi:MAG: chemotaxis protein CheW [Candidatus Obscuribacterales bacterium]|nr:chemotaxis protein CheW [Candidatus Obscuribacterales bacterium]
MVALKELLAFEIDGFQFGVHLESVIKVVQAVEIQPVPDLPEMVLGLINVHGSVTPVLNTRKRLGLPEKSLELTDFFVIASNSHQQIALIVDSIHGVINYSSDQIVKIDSVQSNDASVTVLRIIDGMLLLYDSDKSLNVDQWSTLSVVLQKASDANAAGN